MNPEMPAHLFNLPLPLHQAPWSAAGYQFLILNSEDRIIAAARTWAEARAVAHIDTAKTIAVVDLSTHRIIRRIPRSDYQARP